MNETMIIGLASLMLGGTLGLLMGAIACAAGKADARAENTRDARQTADRLDAWEDMIRSGAPLSRMDQLGLIEAVRYFRREADRLRGEAAANRSPIRMVGNSVSPPKRVTAPWGVSG